MKLRKAIALLCAAVMLTACAEDGVSGSNEISFEYDTLENAEAAFDDLYSLKLNNITLAEGLTVNKPEKLAGMEIVSPRSDSETALKLAEHYFPGEKVEIISEPDPKLLFRLINCDAVGRGQMIYHLGGGFNMMLNRRSFMTFGDTDKHFYLGSSFDDTDAGNAVSEAEKFIADYCEIIGSDCYVATDVICNSTGFDVNFTSQFDGWLAAFGSANAVKAGTVNAEMLSNNNDNPCDVQVTASGKANSIYDSWGRRYRAKYTEQFDKMITLASALEFLDSTLAENMRCKVVSISLVQADKDRTPMNEAAIDTDNISDEELYALTEKTYETSPAWQIILKEQYGQEFKAYIDCITGEFAFGEVLLPG